MASTYEKIATNTLGSAAATVTLSSIPATYTDLVLVIQTRNSAASNEVYGIFNSDTGSNYSYTQITGNGTTAASGRASNSTTMRWSFSNDDFNNNAIIQIMNYANTTTYKTSLVRLNNVSQTTAAVVNLWRSTSAITSITLSNESATNFAVGSTFTLYGIKAA
jgi:hypothetical protein